MTMDFCSCDTYSSPYFAKWRTVRKTHRCIECGHSIAAGARAYYTTGKCEGDWWDGYTCEKCQALLDHVRAHVPCFCYTHGDAWGQTSGDRIGETAFADAVRYANKELPGFAFGIGRMLVGILGRSKP